MTGKQALDQPMSRARLAELAPDMGLPYTADSMRAPLRQLGIEPLYEAAESGTKTTRVAHYDPSVLWTLLQNLQEPRAGRPKRTASASDKDQPTLRELLEEYERRARDMNFTGVLPGDASEAVIWMWRRVAYWRLLVDRERGIELRLLNRVVKHFRGSLELEIGGRSVLPALLKRYNNAMLAYLGGDLGGDGVWFDSWNLMDSVLEMQGVTVVEQSDTASNQGVVNRLTGS